VEGALAGGGVEDGVCAFAAAEKVRAAARPKCVKERMAVLLVGRFPAEWTQLVEPLT